MLIKLAVNTPAIVVLHLPSVAINKMPPFKGNMTADWPRHLPQRRWSVWNPGHHMVTMVTLTKLTQLHPLKKYTHCKPTSNTTFPCHPKILFQVFPPVTLVLFRIGLDEMGQVQEYSSRALLQALKSTFIMGQRTGSYLINGARASRLWQDKSRQSWHNNEDNDFTRPETRLCGPGVLVIHSLSLSLGNSPSLVTVTRQQRVP